MTEVDNNKNQDTVLDPELLKSLEELGITSEEIEDIRKSKSEEEISKAKGEEESKEEEEVTEGKEEEKGEDLEKSISDSESKLEELKKSISEEEAKLNELKSKKAPVVEKQESQDNEILKSISDQLATVSETLANSNKFNEDLKKSFDELKLENDELKKSINELGNQSLGSKSIAKHSFIEKAQGKFEDEDGRSVLSISAQKGLVMDALSKAADDESNDSIKKSINNALVGFNAGGAPISEEVSKYLYDNKGIRLVK